jgi:hypothetical protein
MPHPIRPVFRPVLALSMAVRLALSALVYLLEIIGENRCPLIKVDNSRRRV